MAEEEKESLPADLSAKALASAEALTKEGYWTPLEKKWRDRFFKRTKITDIFAAIGIRANHLTVVGFVVLIWAIFDLFYFGDDVGRQVWLLAFAWITDLLDGPVARNNNEVTALGTLLDHTRDFLLILWMIFLSIYATKSFGWPALFIMNTILLVTATCMFLILLGTWLYQREKRRERRDQLYFEFMQEFLLNDLVTTIGARFHTGLTAFSMIFYLAGIIWKNNFYLYTGIILLIIQLVSLGFYLHEVFQAEYEDKMYKIRLLLRNKKLKNPE
ncbi:MAG: CDP-alcohol phosphatidyltransferase family protein [Parcubacteria group bacterium]|nr:CDP-alcohol phosphatidyltransferase family protein [Parcubacteria group bacterium]